MSTVLPPPPPTDATGPRAEERLVDEQIRRTRQSLKVVDFFSGVLTLTIGILLFLLFASVMEHWVIPGGWSSTGRTLLFVTMLGGIAWYCWRAFWPLVSQTINPAYAAQLIERNTPSLKNSVLNFLLLRTRRQQLSQKVYEAIEQQAAQGLSHASVDTAVDRSILLRLGYILVAVVAICAAYRVLVPKNLTASMGRVLLPWSNIAVPSRVEILSVTPGDTEVARGESLEISAEVLGLRENETVRVRYSTLDKQAVDRDVTLTGSEGTARFQGRLPDRFSAGDNGGIQQDLEYWIEAGDARSEKYRVTVFSRPTLVVEKIRYQFPQYTGLPPREVEGTGDVSALEGTQVSIYALANHDIASANVDFNADGRHDLPMSADKMKATAQFTLQLEDDRRTPKYDSYVLQYKTTNGRASSLPPKYSIDVTPDYAPEVKILAPVDEEGTLVEQLDVPLDTPFTVEVEARDPDFALQQVVVIGHVGGEEVLKHDLLTAEQSGKFIGRMTATPQELNLKVGDVMDYSVAAVDNREPEPNITRTDKLQIRVVGPPEFGEQPQGQQQQGEGQNGGEAGEGGQGQEGMQGPGEAGGSGENGEQQQGQGQASGEGNQQEGQGDSAGEQQGQGGQGGSNQGEQQGENSGNEGESTATEGLQGEQQQPGQPGVGQNDGKPDSAKNPAAGGESEGAPGEQQQPQEGGGEQGQVAADGSDDGSAFDKMTQHFAEQDAESQGQGQSSKADGQTEQSESQNGNESRQGDGQGSPEDQPPTAEKGQNQDQGIDGAQEGEESAGSGAEGQPNEQREQQQSDADQGDKGEQQEAPGGEMSTEQGEPGAGSNPGENEGSTDTDAGRKSRDKSDEEPDAEMNDQEAPGQSNSQQENDSKGGQGGDQSGGGQEGAGQQADAEGTGTAGENTAADDGGGQAGEEGAGENSSQPGQQGASDRPTGESSETKPGEGSKESDQPGGQAGGEQSGEASDQGQESGEPASAGGEQPPSDPSSLNGEQPPPSREGQDSQPSGPPTGEPGAQSPNGDTGGNPSPPPPPGELEPGDAANLEYAKKQTDLVLDRLEDQLEQKDVDKELLKKLGWTEDELRRFVDRWKSLKAEAAAEPSEESRQQLDNALRSLGLNPNRRTGYQSNITKEKLRQLQDSYRGQIPLEYADQVRAYIKGTATVPDEKAD